MEAEAVVESTVTELESVVGRWDRTTTSRSLLKQTGIVRHMKTEGVTEVVVNRPGQIATEGRNGWSLHEAPECTFDALNNLANALCVMNDKHLTAQSPIQNIVLPDGERCQVLIYPACEEGTVSITIRIPSKVRLSMDDYERFEAFKDFVDVSYHKAIPANVDLKPFEIEMLQAKEKRDVRRLLELAIEHKLNIVFVGGTGSGKTTLMKALADLVDPDTRVGTIEDTHELSLPNQWNKVHMFYSAALPPKEIVKSTLRMKFDRVYLAELRGDETWDYLGLLNTGHEGGMTSIHANGPRETFARIATLVKQSEVGLGLDYDFILREAKTTIDLVVFMDRKRLTKLYYDPVEKYLLLNGLK
ncbi:P-type DNA transfer ATPase VirB11 [Paraburkholderia flagellata]|uniref:P-type DNA transfer ATPase VirB11 n=1 Tax=Paraburkholderia flagellata TaxID=2883241 RepID=UPI001F356425|nr:P-type DNA transfer ATPase VirB11 [Paraburkholderia flagellata]